MNNLKEKLTAILQQYTDTKIILNEEVDHNAIMHNFGISSIRKMDIILDIEEYYNIEFNEQELEKIISINDMVHIIKNKISGKD